jgi:hypothetical protein
LANVLIIGDTHCPGMRQGYVDFLQRVADSHSVTRVVHIGDLVDWASISFHEKSPGLSNATREFDAARRQVATLHRAFPKADWLIGNHDALTEYTEEARRVFVAGRLECEAEYSRAEQRGAVVGTTVWGRANEHSRKLALLHAISVDHRKPRIDADAARWGTRFVMHQTRRLLFMAQNHVADNPFHAECLKLIRKLRHAPGGRLPHSVLLKRMKIDARIFQDLINTLEQQGDIATVMQATTGQSQREYRLRVEMEVKQEDETAALK